MELMRPNRAAAPAPPVATGVLLAAVVAIPFASVTVAGRVGSFVASPSTGTAPALGAFALGVVGAAFAYAACRCIAACAQAVALILSSSYDDLMWRLEAAATRVALRVAPPRLAPVPCRVGRRGPPWCC